MVNDPGIYRNLTSPFDAPCAILIYVQTFANMYLWQRKALAKACW